MANPLSTFKTDHHVILGVALIVIGGFGVIGSITGRLPAMLAGLFDDKDLVTGSTGSGTSVASNQPINSNVSDVAGTGITSDLQTPFDDLINSLGGLLP